MKATLDVLDELYKQVKAKRALEGRSIREVALVLFERDLAGESASASRPEVAGQRELDGGPLPLPGSGRWESTPVGLSATAWRRAAMSYLLQRTREGGQFLVSDHVLAESYQAFQHHHGASKKETLAVLRDFLVIPGVENHGRGRRGARHSSA